MRCDAGARRGTAALALAGLSLAILATALFSGAGCGGGAVTGGTGTITGTVVDATDPSQPVGNAYAYVPIGARSLGASTRQDTAEQSTYTDSNGNFVLTGVAVGARYLRIRPPTGSGATEEHEYALDLTDGATVTIRPTIVPDALLASIGDVTITDADGATQFTLLPSTQKQLYAEVTDTSGQVMQLAPTWTTTGSVATVSSSGLVTAGATLGTGKVYAVVGTASDSADITVANQQETTYEIAFYSNRDTGDGVRDNEIFVMNEDGTNVRQLTDNAYDDRAPWFSRDGQRIAFASDPDSDGQHDIYVMDRDGTNVQPLVVNAGSDDKYPVFSPVSNDLAFLSNRGGDSDIWLLRDGETLPTNLTDEDIGVPGDDLIFDWSPDGATIAFRSDRHNPGGGNYEVFTIVLATGDEANLTQNVADDGSPSYAPDGSALAFSSDRADALFHLFLYRFADSSVSQLTSDASLSDGDPDWGAGGGRILFVRGAGDQAEIYVTRTDGGGTPTNLTNTTGFDGNPRWSPN